MPKHIDFHQEARKKLLKGAQLLAKTTAVTYGPQGRTVMLDRAAGLMATKDGVTVAREVVLSDPVENLGAHTLMEACVRVNDQVGDGTTTAAILSAVLLEEAHRLVVAGYDPMHVSQGILKAADRAIDVIKGIAVPIGTQEELERVAFVASNEDSDVASSLAEACMAVGKDGTISIEDGHGIGVDLLLKDGMEIDKGVPPAFLRDHGGVERTIEGPLVALIAAKLVTVQDIQHVLEESSQWPNNDLILLAYSIEGQALTTMLVNDAQQVVRSCGIQAPGFGPKQKDYLEDIAALSGATLVDPDLGMDWTGGFDPEWFGSFRKATLKAKSSLFLAYDEASGMVSERIQELRRQMQEASSDYDRDRISERMARLSGGLAILKVGGPTESVLKERRARVEDALGAVRAALEEGVVPGGGSAYLTASEYLSTEGKDLNQAEQGGWSAMAKALKSPLATLAHNAGEEGPSVVHRTTKARRGDDSSWIGWDVMQRRLRDFSEDPLVLDPTPVATTAVEAAASVTATLITAEVSITGEIL